MPAGLRIALIESTPSQKPASKYLHGRVRESWDQITLAAVAGGAAVAAGGTGASQVRLGWVPAGAKIKGGQLHWKGAAGTAGLGTSTSVTVGDEFDCDRFLSATATTAASDSIYGTCGRFNVLDAQAIPLNAAYANSERVGIGYEYTCGSYIVVGLNNGTFTGVLSLSVEYTTE